MPSQDQDKSASGVFITFSGNCKEALSFYQTCFGGILHFESFGKELYGYADMPVISGSLVSDRITIYGSDLVHDEGRKIGNYLSIFLPCQDENHRQVLIKKLSSFKRCVVQGNDEEQKLIEVVDAFDVTWVLSI